MLFINNADTPLLLNSTARFIFEELCENGTDSLIESIVRHYSIEEFLATQAAEELISLLISKGVLSIPSESDYTNI